MFLIFSNGECPDRHFPQNTESECNIMYYLSCLGTNRVLFVPYAKFHTYMQGIAVLFCDGTRRYGIPAPSFQVKKNYLLCILRISDFRLVSTGTYYLVRHLFLYKKALLICNKKIIIVCVVWLKVQEFISAAYGAHC